MKTIKILVLISILAVTQSFALSKTQQNILFGLGAGVIIAHTLKSHNNTYRYEKPSQRIIYVDSRKIYTKQPMRKNHRNSRDYYSRANHHNKHYHRDDYRYNFKTANQHNKRAHHRD